MARIHTCDFYLASEVLTEDERDSLADSSNITWGDGNRTLVTVKRINDYLCGTAGTANLPPDALIDLEN